MISEIKDQFEKQLSLASIYSCLARLSKKKLIEVSHFGPATAERGGKKKIYYKITNKGKTALNEKLYEIEEMSRIQRIFKKLNPLFS